MGVVYTKSNLSKAMLRFIIHHVTYGAKWAASSTHVRNKKNELFFYMYNNMNTRTCVCEKTDAQGLACASCDLASHIHTIHIYTQQHVTQNTKYYMHMLIMYIFIYYGYTLFNYEYAYMCMPEHNVIVSKRCCIQISIYT